MIEAGDTSMVRKIHINEISQKVFIEGTLLNSILTKSQREYATFLTIINSSCLNSSSKMLSYSNILFLPILFTSSFLPLESTHAPNGH